MESFPVTCIGDFLQEIFCNLYHPCKNIAIHLYDVTMRVFSNVVDIHNI